MSTIEKGHSVELSKKGKPDRRSGWEKFGNLINRQGATRAGRGAKFSKMNKRACPFIRPVKVVGIHEVIPQ